MLLPDVNASFAPPARDRPQSPALLKALRVHLGSMELEGQVKGWTAEQRRLVFPNKAGHLMQHSTFVEDVWQPLLAKAELPYRRYQSTRHTFTWPLNEAIKWLPQ